MIRNKLGKKKHKSKKIVTNLTNLQKNLIGTELKLTKREIPRP